MKNVGEAKKTGWRKTWMEKGQLSFSNILTKLNIVILSSIILFAALVYSSVEKLMLETIHTYVRDNLTQIGNGITFIANSAKDVAVQFYFDPEIRDVLNYESPDPQTVMKSNVKLGNLKVSTPFLQSIYLYNLKTKNANMVYPEDTELLGKYIKLRDNKFNPIPRTIHLNHGSTIETAANVYTFVFSDIRKSEKELNNAIVMNFSDGWIQNILKNVDLSGGSDVFIVDDKARVISTTLTYPFLSDISEREFIRKIFQSSDPSGYFTANIDGEKMLVTYVNSEPMGWKFIRTTSYGTITKKVEDMKAHVILICLAGILFVVAISILVSKSIYRPIQGLLSRTNRLEKEMRDNRNILKMHYLNNLLSGSVDWKERAAGESGPDHQLRFYLNKPYLVIVFKIDDYEAFCKKYSIHEQKMLRYAITNIIDEIMTSKFASESVETDDSVIETILNIDEVTAGLEQVKGVIRELQAAVEQYLHLSVSASISSSGSQLNDVKILYEEALEGCEYRLLYGHKCIIALEEIRADMKSKYVYPFEKEKIMVEAVANGNADQILMLFDEITAKLKQFSPRFLKMTITRLIVAINMAIEKIEADMAGPLNLELNGFLADLYHYETFDQISDAFHRMILSTFSSENGPSTKSKSNKMVRSVTEYIQQNYADVNLSVATIAPLFEISPNYLGQIFKSITAKSTADYITEVRMNIVRDLLANSSMQVYEIAEKTGIANVSYFYTLFKRIHGMTPNEYRNSMARPK